MDVELLAGKPGLGKEEPAWLARKSPCIRQKAQIQLKYLPWVEGAGDEHEGNNPRLLPVCS